MRLGARGAWVLLVPEDRKWVRGGEAMQAASLMTLCTGKSSGEEKQGEKQQRGMLGSAKGEGKEGDVKDSEEGWSAR